MSLLSKLWIYTNYDCNLRCAYCVARSSPRAPRRAIGLDKVRRLVDDAVALGFEHIFFTGGEPFLLDEIYAMLAHSSARVPTTVLTNAMLLRGARLDRLVAVANANLTLQVSLDGGRPQEHDAWRGQGTWQKTVEGIEALQANGVRVRLSTTVTPANQDHLEQLCEFHRALGIAEEDHTTRALAKRGFSEEGLELDRANLAPEITVSADGVFWHPLSTDQDMQVSQAVFPLCAALAAVQTQLEAISPADATPRKKFT
ncbi:MAG: radical SAM protein [Chloroflexi bacterium]|nr:radical SAM protein [Chloroflexota bacterium]